MLWIFSQKLLISGKLFGESVNLVASGQVSASCTPALCFGIRVKHRQQQGCHLLQVMWWPAASSCRRTMNNRDGWVDHEED